MNSYKICKNSSIPIEIFAKVCYNIWKTIIGELYPLENGPFSALREGVAPLYLKGSFHTMSKYIEKAENQTLPLVVLRGVVAFPGMTVNCDIPKDSFKSAAAAQSAASGGELVVLASLLDISEPDTGEPDITKLCTVGTVARIKQLIRTPDGDTRLIAEGQCRAQLSSIIPLGKFTVANVIWQVIRCWSP